ncbi:MAG: hypothetical protein EXX96DRAFT_634512 [Benjaminiella poitrasii]|nr:MAG: hypothetical protein EXX96DRAFT_634512 [Benjaminiella poitrasii]
MKVSLVSIVFIFFPVRSKVNGYVKCIVAFRISSLVDRLAFESNFVIDPDQVIHSENFVFMHVMNLLLLLIPFIAITNQNYTSIAQVKDALYTMFLADFNLNLKLLYIYISIWFIYNANHRPSTEVGIGNDATIPLFSRPVLGASDDKVRTVKVIRLRANLHVNHLTFNDSFCFCNL